MSLIRVINEGPEDFTGRYDGKNYFFQVGKPVDVSVEVARHCFGFGETDKREALSRMGWLKPWGSMKEALERLAKIRFLEGTVVFEDSAESTEKPATNARPHVNRSKAPSTPPAEEREPDMTFGMST